jgi:hypothetical protein
VIEFGMVSIRKSRNFRFNSKDNAAKVATGNHNFVNELIRKIERTQTAVRSIHEYSSYLWNPWMKKSMPVNQRKKVRNMPLYGRVGSLRGAGSRERRSENFSLCCFSRVYFSNSSCCIINYTYNMNKQTFLLPERVVVPYSNAEHVIIEECRGRVKLSITLTVSSILMCMVKLVGFRVQCGRMHKN